MIRWKHFLFRKVIAYGLLATGVLLLVISLVAWLWTPGTRTYRLTVTAGSSVETRHKIAEYFAQKAPKLDLDITIKATAGSLEALQKVEAREIDLALINGFVRLDENTTVRQVAELYTEPLHVLVKDGPADRMDLALEDLIGKRVNVSRPGSGTYLLAVNVLKHLGLKPARPGNPEGVILENLRYREILQVLEEMKQAKPEAREELRKRLPDVFFLVTTLPSQVASQLVKVAGYRLVALRFSKAFSAISIEKEVAGYERLDQLHVRTVQIPEFMYRYRPAVPPRPCETLGSPLLLIAHQDVPDEAILRLLPLLYDGPVEHLYHPITLSEMVPIYPLPSATLRYRDRDKPLVRADVVEMVKGIATFLGPFLGGILALYGYYRWRQLLRFNHYFSQLLHINLVARGLQEDAQAPRGEKERTVYLENELARLQSRAVKDFCRNYFYGDGVLQNLLVMMAETRFELLEKGRSLNKPMSPSAK